MAASMSRAPLVFPIRFATRNAAVQTTTRELSPKGVSVRCLEPPLKGTLIAMKLYLPGRRDGLSAQGLVREITTDGDGGFWADFHQLGMPEQAEISELLARRERAAASKPIGAIDLHPISADDARRAFPRIPARFAVRFATVQDFVLEYAANISAGGVFVHSLDPPQLKSIVRVEMQLPGDGPPVPARGVVVHRVSREEAEERGTIPGMGVQFMDGDDDFRSRIDDAIAKILGS
jgi:uncharacterized protein (TIGR02266 family)